ncbi:S8 family serine peptidase [Streptomyces sp. NPDC050617]|uniref:S8 family serine peptidase n=1 Tax=Streptomyces sp. NPDC050617 TaxID=3154628 RepID=UPI00341FC88F
MRSSRRPAPRGLAGAALAAVLLIPALAVPADADSKGDSGSLPQIPSTLEDGQQCTPASKKSSSKLPWAQSFLNLDRAWQLNRGAGVTVAVVGTGADTAHVPSLAGQVEAGPDVMSSGSAADDCVGQGTFLAGIIAGRQQKDAAMAGVAPQARVLAVRATDKQGVTTPAALAKGIRAAADGGARVIDVPLGVDSAPDDLKSAVRDAQGKGALVVAAADPTGQGRGPSYPAELPGVVAVAAVGPGGVPPQKNGAAQNGSGASATQPELSAPGVSAVGPGPGGPGQFTGSGDGVASAFVAGTAALVASYHPNLTGKEIAHRLDATANGTGAAAPDPALGWGAVDPVQAISAALTGGDSPRHGPADQRAAAMPPAPSDGARNQSLVIAAIAAGAVLLVAFAAAVLPRARRRGWRPGGPTGTAG